MTKYKIIENFLIDEDYKELSNLNLDDVPDNGIRVYNNSINDENIINISCISEALLKRLNKNYHQIAVQILNELNPKKKNYYDYSEFHITKTGKNYHYPIHNDIPDKLLSGVIYLTPDDNKGTIFYENKNGDQPTEIKWKKNSALFFSRSNDTWHSFSSDGENHRIVLIYNLMTKNIKKISEIDNFNYSFYIIQHFIEKIRQKIRSLF
tara:strand:- start:554 stop:1177 length:624 start_codon:yes stop_codon:yes gene_type:complete